MSRRLLTPSLDGASQWLNAGPLGDSDLRGHVVVVNFWTFTCINWLRTAPYLRAWSQAYADDGLIVVGVHTPEFSFEHDLDRVRRATEERGIAYPVAVDNDFEVWTSFDNHVWPALYFLDEAGALRDFHYGEGRYAGSERVIQKLLRVDRDLISTTGSGVEAEADWHHLRSPETYLGHVRGERFSSREAVELDTSCRYELPKHLRLNRWGLAGEWTIGPESTVLGQAGGSIAYRFRARDAHLVMSRGSREPTPFRVLIDSEAPGASHGVDVDEDGCGMLREDRLYHLVRQHPAVRERTLEITFHAPGVGAYAFTFG